VAYGNLFMKGYYYSDDPSSVRHPSNIFHIEYDLDDDGLRERIIKYYRDHFIPYGILPSVRAARAVRYLPEYFRRRGCRAMRVSSLKDIAREFFAMLAFGRYKAYHELMAPFKSAKLALVGYDFLFPKPLSLALDTMGIRTVAVQERFLSSIPNITTVLLDCYFVWGRINQEGLAKDANSHVSSVFPVGPPRRDIFSDALAKKRGTPADAGRAKTIVALDYLSFEDPEENRLSPHVNWKNNMVFYQDMIRLASDLPGVRIILRGKNDAWCRMPYFQEVYRSMRSLPNLTVDHDYSKFNVSYDLVSEADLVIGKYTSILDEALAAGKPVLVHDYSRTMSKETHLVFDYNGLDIFVFSYRQMKERVEKILYKNEYIEPMDLQACREYFYSAMSEGRVLEKIHSGVDRLLCEQSP
jgi:glycosyltransferase involved in cell wall biosynthesis